MLSAAPISEEKKTLRIALVGNPNTGKTTLFNRLTGLRQRVGNYPGVTVSKKIGAVKLPRCAAEVIDLPGTYSLSATSLDERIVVDALAGHLAGTGTPDAVVCVVDATNLLRNLFLASQIAELGLPMVIVLNQWDQASRQGLRIDHKELSRRLGVPVVPAVATRQEGIGAVLGAMQESLDQSRAMVRIEWPDSVRQAIALLRSKLSGDRALEFGTPELQRILFDVDSAILDKVDMPEEKIRAALGEARDLLFQDGYNPTAAEALLHYEHLGQLLDGITTKAGSQSAGPTNSIDRLLMHRWWGLAIFVAIMYVTFLSVYAWADPFMKAIEWGKGWLQEAVSPSLAGMPMLQSLVSDGIVEGVGAFLVFLPQILILFFFIALLEDTGYMARAAFLMDKMFSWCGLNGKSFVPLLSSYACAVPGIMAARTIEEPKARLTTILIAPLMSCSARLPVYVLLIGAFIAPRYGAFTASLVLFGMHFVGLAVAVPTAWAFNKFLRTKPHPFVLELPGYRVPRLRDVAWRMFQSGREFVKTAGTIIFALTIVVWALLYFPRSQGVEEAAREAFVTAVAAERGVGAEAIAVEIEEDASLAADLEHAVDSAFIEQSYLGRLGKAIQPVFAPAGFDWKITVGVLASFPAREVIVSTLGVIYSLGGDVDEEDTDLRQAMAHSTWPQGAQAGTPIFTLPVVVGIMVFFALCCQCGATLAVITREAGLKWAVFSFCYMTTLAWLGAVLAYQTGTRLF